MWLNNLWGKSKCTVVEQACAVWMQNGPKTNTDTGSAPNEGWKLLTKTSQPMLWSQPGMSVISGSSLSLGFPGTWRWGSPTASASRVCWGTREELWGLPHTWKGTAWVPPSFVSRKQHQSVRLRFWCGHWSLQELFYFSVLKLKITGR